MQLLDIFNDTAAYNITGKRGGRRGNPEKRVGITDFRAARENPHAAAFERNIRRVKFTARERVFYPSGNGRD